MTSLAERFLSDFPVYSDAFTLKSRDSIVHVDASLPPSSSQLSADVKGKGRARDQHSGGNGAAKVTTYRIHNLIPEVELPESYVTSLDPIIRKFVQGVLHWGEDESKERLPSFEVVFKAVETLTTLKNLGGHLYDNVEKTLGRCISDILRDLKSSDKVGIVWLEDFMKAWEWLEDRLEIIRAVFLHLDRHFALRGDRTTLQQLGRAKWTTALDLGDRHGPIRSSLTVAIREWSQKDRNAKNPLSASTSKSSPPTEAENDVIKRFIFRMIDSDLYVRFFQSDLHKITFEYYSEEAPRAQEALTAATYFDHVQTRYEQESEFVRSYLPKASLEAVILPLDEAFLSDYLGKETLAKALVERMADSDSRTPASLSHVFKASNRLSALPILQDAFQERIEALVKDIVKPTDTKDNYVVNDTMMITRLVHFKAYVDEILSKIFVTTGGRPIESFDYAVRKAFVRGFAVRKNKPAEMLAKYLDAEMRRGQQGSSDSEFKAKLDAALGLYGFSPDHDVFRIYYMRALAKRLLLQRSASDDFEKEFLQKLSREFDSEFEKGTKMFEDLTLSRTMLPDFHKEQPDEARFTALVFQPSNWPTYTETTLILPQDMQRSLSRFEAFYQRRHKSRNLSWRYALGTASLVSRFDKGRKELHVSLHQATVLLMFNERETLSFADIKEATKIDTKELERTMQSLALGKKRVLTKSPAGKDVHDHDQFTFNGKFWDDRYIVRINSIQEKETPEEAKQASAAIDESRQWAVDAAVVRIMKGKKTMTYEMLKNETTQAVLNMFQPDVQFIKKRIEALVEQDYLERDEDKPNVYKYVA